VNQHNLEAGAPETKPLRIDRSPGVCFPVLLVAQGSEDLLGKNSKYKSFWSVYRGDYLVFCQIICIRVGVFLMVRIPSTVSGNIVDSMSKSWSHHFSTDSVYRIQVGPCFHWHDYRVGELVEENASPCCPQLSSNHPVWCASRSPPLCTSVAEMHKREGVQSTCSKQRPSATAGLCTSPDWQLTLMRRVLADLWE
jgi:hypothetical protein